jgi:hypothetical protein
VNDIIPIAGPDNPEPLTDAEERYGSLAALERVQKRQTLSLQALLGDIPEADPATRHAYRLSQELVRTIRHAMAQTGVAADGDRVYPERGVLSLCHVEDDEREARTR